MIALGFRHQCWQYLIGCARSVTTRTPEAYVKSPSRACRSASECSHFLTRPSFWPYLIASRNFHDDISNGSGVIVYTPHKQTNRHCWKQPISLRYRCMSCNEWLYTGLQKGRWHQCCFSLPCLNDKCLAADRTSTFTWRWRRPGSTARKSRILGECAWRLDRDPALRFGRLVTPSVSPVTQRLGA